MATHYERGRRFEYRVRDRLYKDGAVFVMRAAQSKGPADLVALWSEKQPTLVQCKTGTATMTKAQRAEFADLATRAGAEAYLAEPGENNRGIRFTRLDHK